MLKDLFINPNFVDSYKLPLICRNTNFKVSILHDAIGIGGVLKLKYLKLADRRDVCAILFTYLKLN